MKGKSKLANDLKQVERGQENNLTLMEVGQVTPRYAGSVMVEDSRAVFTPSSEFSGMAWFSYSLRGDVGRGWLHKADVAVIVGDPEGDIYEMDVAAGQAKTFKLPGDGVISQVLPPKQAELHELPSDASVHILRVNADAKGSETIQYRAGGQRHERGDNIGWDMANGPSSSASVGWTRSEEPPQTAHSSGSSPSSTGARRLRARP